MLALLPHLGERLATIVGAELDPTPPATHFSLEGAGGGWGLTQRAGSAPGCHGSGG
jgi:hypothetical protein